jgi:hypothetical protein
MILKQSKFSLACPSEPTTPKKHRPILVYLSCLESPQKLLDTFL